MPSLAYRSRHVKTAVYIDRRSLSFPLAKEPLYPKHEVTPRNPNWSNCRADQELRTFVDISRGLHFIARICFSAGSYAIPSKTRARRFARKSRVLAMCRTVSSRVRWTLPHLTQRHAHTQKPPKVFLLDMSPHLRVMSEKIQIHPYRTTTTTPA
ncbi:hypothetical protein PROFUN_04967 [Planoprotostelium fungivorum]|uniref:Uncharacterized protein n=1 Tax=Planoprotostelium fungivorum TaxID=1890364 RepID=A0A2P6NSP4_9EUKA|nr:hypothetical protein PROFUN_04967 [Planoprotostelium fungivorum]